MKRKLSICILLVLLLAGCQVAEEPVEIPFREDLIPADAIKMSPENDTLPPVLLSDEYQEPVPFTLPCQHQGG